MKYVMKMSGNSIDITTKMNLSQLSVIFKTIINGIIHDITVIKIVGRYVDLIKVFHSKETYLLINHHPKNN